MLEFDYTTDPLKEGPAQDARDLGPKLTPTEPSKKATKNTRKRLEEYKKKHPDYVDLTHHK